MTHTLSTLARRNLLRAFMVVAAFVAIAATAYAQPGNPYAPCDSFIIDTQGMIPGPIETWINWTGQPPTYQNQVGTISMPYTLKPGPPDIPMTWTFRNGGPSGPTFGPFNCPCDTTFCDPFQPGRCIRVVAYYHVNPCWHEFQILSVQCPDSVKCP